LAARTSIDPLRSIDGARSLELAERVPHPDRGVGLELVGITR
jgi:hypothetical protein